uniref:Uncharacterized protein n=1 Tax=Arundo donax TaxID=35708 RepID=A0A0A9GAN5_ARUDO
MVQIPCSKTNRLPLLRHHCSTRLRRSTLPLLVVASSTTTLWELLMVGSTVATNTSSRTSPTARLSSL